MEIKLSDHADSHESLEINIEYFICENSVYYLTIDVSTEPISYLYSC